MQKREILKEMNETARPFVKWAGGKAQKLI